MEVPGVDVVFIGPMDLSASMGYLGNPNHPEVQNAIAIVEKTALKAKKALGTISNNWEQAWELYRRGYQVIMLMSDSVSLGKLASETVTKFREAFPEG